VIPPGLDRTFLAPLEAPDPSGLVLRNVRSGEVLARALEAALHASSRARGLLGRNRLDDGAALLLAPCRSIHTCFMRFPIDVLFAARTGRVVKLYPALPAWRLAFAARAWMAIELPAGTIPRTGTMVGDRLEVRAA
jgi:uncharacterized membrane protein (UPF0127 family)